MKLCGQRFWELISGNGKLYIDIIEPIGYKAREKNKEFAENYAQIINKLTLETGKKDGGNGRVNYFLIWKGEARTVQLDPPTETCSEDLDKNAPGLYRNDNGVPCIWVYESKEQPSLSVAFTNGGQLINFSNELEEPFDRARMR